MLEEMEEEDLDSDFEVESYRARPTRRHRRRAGVAPSRAAPRGPPRAAAAAPRALPAAGAATGAAAAGAATAAPRSLGGRRAAPGWRRRALWTARLGARSAAQCCGAALPQGAARGRGDHQGGGGRHRGLRASPSCAPTTSTTAGCGRAGGLGLGTAVCSCCWHCCGTPGCRRHGLLSLLTDRTLSTHHPTPYPQGKLLQFDGYHKRHKVAYDDGEEEWVSLAREPFRWLTPRARSSGCTPELRHLMTAAGGRGPGRRRRGHARPRCSRGRRPARPRWPARRGQCRVAGGLSRACAGEGILCLRGRAVLQQPVWGTRKRLHSRAAPGPGSCATACPAAVPAV